MRARLFPVVLLFFVAGCIAYGRDFPVYAVRSIENNSTTQRQIFADFGEPVRRGIENGLETWTYSYQYYEFGQLRDTKELHVVFNPNNTVRAYSYSAR